MEHKKGFNMSVGVKSDEVEVRIKYFYSRRCRDWSYQIYQANN